jgi:spore coat polysaccharide biosynthesis protein SpsF
MIAAIIQARMGSTRLPGKVMKTLSGKPMLWHIITRLSYSKKIKKIIIATTDKDEDKVIAKFAQETGTDFYCGSSEDVLDRYYQAARRFGVCHIVRITADCPMIDPEVVDKVIDFYQTKKCDYASNVLKSTMPDGLDTEVFSFQALEKVWREAKKPSEREHVTLYIYNHPELFKIDNRSNTPDLSGMRWVVDEEIDYRFVVEVYKNLYKDGEIFYMNDILDLLSNHPELSNINKKIKRNEGLAKSLREDFSI